LRSHIDAVISFLIEAMARQTSTKADPLSTIRLLELGQFLDNACARQAELDLPDTLVHNDLNTGNILWDGKKCVFTDWCEAAIGNPFLSCERLCQLNLVHAECVRNAYRECWSERLSMERINEAIVLGPLLAVYACLYGRGDWLNNTREVRPNFESYARSLARHMDRAARNPILMEMLCR
jgi:aminoglycoside phosphotransferase (APT) family kinase protein